MLQAGTVWFSVRKSYFCHSTWVVYLLAQWRGIQFIQIPVTNLRGQICCLVALCDHLKDTGELYRVRCDTSTPKRLILKCDKGTHHCCHSVICIFSYVVTNLNARCAVRGQSVRSTIRSTCSKQKHQSLVDQKTGGSNKQKKPLTGIMQHCEPSCANSVLVSLLFELLAICLTNVIAVVLLSFFRCNYSSQYIQHTNNLFMQLMLFLNYFPSIFLITMHHQGQPHASSW